MKLKKIVARQKEKEPAPRSRIEPGSEPRTERVKTTLMIPRYVLTRLQDLSRQRGISVNALMLTYIHNGLKAERMIESARYQTMPQMPPFPEHLMTSNKRTRSPEDKLDARFGKGVSYKDDMDDATWFCPWDKVEQYAKALADDPSATFIEIGRSLRLREDEARAADLAIETGDWDVYREARDAHR